METEQMAEVYGAPGTRPSDRDSKAARKQARAEEARRQQEQLPGMEGLPPYVNTSPKPSKKHKKKGRSLRDMAFETMSPSNVITRDDMARGVHQPQPVSGVLSETFGPISNGSVNTEAMAVINEFGKGIRTGITEWAIIQKMVEEAYRRGHRDGFHLASGR